MDNSFLYQSVAYLKGVGPTKASLLKSELNIISVYDLLNHFPLRHLDKSTVSTIASINENTEYIQIMATVKDINLIGGKYAKRLVVRIQDNTRSMELTWFQSINWTIERIKTGQQLLIFGKVSFYNNRPTIAHPEFELFDPNQLNNLQLEPIYPSTEKLKQRGINGRQIAQLTKQIFTKLNENDIAETIPNYIISKENLLGLFAAYKNIHFPQNEELYEKAKLRLKFEELFIGQFNLAHLRFIRNNQSKGFAFLTVGNYFNNFYENHLPFTLTNAQKKVFKEIRKNTSGGSQMNRLLQGDVGSGKTIVALLTMLLALDNGYQTCFMAPTEILANQHFETIQKLTKSMGILTVLLTGNTTAKNKKIITKGLAEGTIQWVIGTHSLIEDKIIYKNLGLAIIDEQHKFGVEQRSKLYKKASLPPHILAMTATPIPRTLAMTEFGDLDISVIDELPPGRNPVLTMHKFENARHHLYNFIKEEISKGRQIFYVYPIIDESEKLTFENLNKGYEYIKSYFPEPQYLISVAHGKLTKEMKESNMARFVEGKTQILVATTVIEVGVNIPNASVMVIESAERFGLSQLHQLRGRVGRGSEKSYCILLTSNHISQDAQQRMRIMTETNDGFIIAEKDLELRGPGDLEGTRQSGALHFKIANLIEDKEILLKAKKYANYIFEKDPQLQYVENKVLIAQLNINKQPIIWGKIS